MIQTMEKKYGWINQVLATVKERNMTLKEL
jgi:hypothetical protein